MLAMGTPDIDANTSTELTRTPFLILVTDANSYGTVRKLTSEMVFAKVNFMHYSADIRRARPQIVERMH